MTYTRKKLAVTRSTSVVNRSTTVNKRHDLNVIDLVDIFMVCVFLECTINEKWTERERETESIDVFHNPSFEFASFQFFRMELMCSKISFRQSVQMCRNKETKRNVHHLQFRWRQNGTCSSCRHRHTVGSNTSCS